ncbi:MAG: rhodanese-like domain-containing protein [Desulfobacteraceae bacterium]|nr:MAG: rhodanese-like domain-containing protein [Desulfobacteraceae bacterium]
MFPKGELELRSLSGEIFYLWNGSMRNNTPKEGSIWLRALLQACSILFLAVGVGLVVNYFRADRLPLIGDWSPEGRLAKEMVIALDEAGRLHESGSAVFVDARSPEEYREGHILGARNLPLKDVEVRFEPVMSGVPMEQTIVVYCDGDECSLSEEVAKELYFRGYENVKVMVNGWTRWVDAGFPTEKG